MREGPDIAVVASLIGDPARANMVAALMAGQALTAGELAEQAGVTPPTASGHLARLLDAGLLAVEKQGRHRYYRLANAEIATAIEGLIGLAHLTAGNGTRRGPRDPDLRRARLCYDHLAGELGVELHDAFVARGFLVLAGNGLALGDSGRDHLMRAGIDIPSGRRALCRSCLDWSERRHHLAGALGAALARHVFDRGWARLLPRSRVVLFSAGGLGSFRHFTGAATDRD